MRSRLIVAFLLLLGTSVCAGSHNPAIDAAHKTTHAISLHAPPMNKRMGCSATAIGPHALLTASHCEEPADEIQIDDDDYAILGIARDGYDHSIFLVTATFETWATFATEPAQVGDDIFIFGNPGGLEDVFRKGYVAEVSELSGTPVLYDFNGWPGDSGAGIFNTKGELVGVASIGITQTKKGDNPWPDFKIMGGWYIHFSPDVIKAVVAFAPAKSTKE